MDDREVQVVLKMRKCRFFNGIQHDTCSAGVNYRELVGGADPGWALGIPCLGDADDAGRRWTATKRPGAGMRAVVPCLKMDTPLRAEAEREVDESNTYIADVVRRLDAGEDVPGVVVCGRRTQPEERKCPQSVDGKCSLCGSPVDSIYGLGSGYGGIGGYSYCTSEDCGEVHDFVEDNGE